MQLMGIDAYARYKNQKKADNFKAWGMRHLGQPVYPSRNNYWDNTDHSEDDFLEAMHMEVDNMF